jgi:hypothetical protein
MRKSKKNKDQIDKAVFILDNESQYRNTPFTPKTFKYVEQVIGVMMKKYGVDKDYIFIGGTKHEMIMYLSGVVEMFYFVDIDIKLDEQSFIADDDFFMPNKL